MHLFYNHLQRTDRVPVTITLPSSLALLQIYCPASVRLTVVSVSLLVTRFPSTTWLMSIPLVADDSITWVPVVLENQVTLGSGRPDTEQVNVTALSSVIEIEVGDSVGLGATEGKQTQCHYICLIYHTKRHLHWTMSSNVLVSMPTVLLPTQE